MLKTYAGKLFNLNLRSILCRNFSKLSTFKKCIICFTITLLILLAVMIFCNKSSRPSNKVKVVILENRQIYPNKYILLWTPFCARKWDVMKHTDLNTINLEESDEYDYSDCMYKNCVITSNRTLLKNVTHYDALIFHGPEGRDLFLPLPEYRSPHQVYIMGNLEPPASFREVSDFNLYNWTMTYRLNSDIIWPYTNFYDKLTLELISPNDEPNWRPVDKSIKNLKIMNQIKGKTKMAVQFVSNCHAKSKRALVTEELAKFIDVDVFGKCGKLKCSTEDTHCDDMLDTDYRFYFAFENEITQDYVTEKLFRSYEHTIIPVVYGGANYSKFAPPHSYINVADFNTIEDLAKYLKYLSENPEIYAKYFWWRTYYRKGSNNPFCDICIKLNEETEKVQIYNDILHWMGESL